MRPKKIVFIALETFSLVGGAQNFNRRLINTLAEYTGSREFPPPVVLILRDNAEDIPEINHIQIRAASSRGKMIRMLLREMRKGADMLLVGQINLAPLALLAKCVRPNLNTLLITHGIEVWNDPQHRPKRLMDTLSLFAINQIASVSQYTARVMAEAYRIPFDRFHSLPNAIDLQPHAPSNRRGEPTILSVSRLGTGDEQKHVDKVIQAVALLKGRLPTIVYEIVGDGPLRSKLEQLARDLGVSSSVRFLGRTSDEEKEAAYRRAWAFVLPSSKEGFGIVYLEAWLHRLPVICSTAGAASEVVTHEVDGFAVDPLDVPALSEAIFKLLTDEEVCTNFGEKGFAKICKSYTQTSFSQNLAKILDKILVED